MTTKARWHGNFNDVSESESGSAETSSLASSEDTSDSELGEGEHYSLVCCHSANCQIMCCVSSLAKLSSNTVGVILGIAQAFFRNDTDKRLHLVKGLLSPGIIDPFQSARLEFETDFVLDVGRHRLKFSLHGEKVRQPTNRNDLCLSIFLSLTYWRPNAAENWVGAQMRR
jgi:hypothetical protein